MRIRVCMSGLLVLNVGGDDFCPNAVADSLLRLRGEAVIRSHQSCCTDLGMLTPNSIFDMYGVCVPVQMT